MQKLLLISLSKLFSCKNNNNNNNTNISHTRTYVQGLESLQHMQICHKDLSPENFIILDNTSLVIDFGMCLRIPYSDAGVHFITPKVACGKKPYIAPEIIRQLPFDGHAVDIWAGIVLLFQHSFVICIHIFHCTETWCFHSRSHLLLCLSIYICP